MSIITEELKKIGQGMIFLTIILSIIIYFKLNYFQIWILVISISAVLGLWKKSFKLGKWLWDSFTTGCFFIVMFILKPYGVTGYILSTFFACSYMLYKRRTMWLEAKYKIETMIWGKPLKEFINNKERVPKFTLVMKK